MIVIFLQAIGIKVQVGYGLTESSPVIAARQPYLNVIIYKSRCENSYIDIILFTNIYKE